jgi:hypothetical protein
VENRDHSHATPSSAATPPYPARMRDGVSAPKSVRMYGAFAYRSHGLVPLRGIRLVGWIAPLRAPGRIIVVPSLSSAQGREDCASRYTFRSIQWMD